MFVSKLFLKILRSLTQHGSSLYFLFLLEKHIPSQVLGEIFHCKRNHLSKFVKHTLLLSKMLFIWSQQYYVFHKMEELRVGQNENMSHFSLSYTHLSFVWEYADENHHFLTHLSCSPIIGLIPAGLHILWWGYTVYFVCVCLCVRSLQIYAGARCLFIAQSVIFKFNLSHFLSFSGDVAL